MAAIASVGAWLAVTLNVLVPLTAPLAARTVADPLAAGAVYRPVASIDPIARGLRPGERRLRAQGGAELVVAGGRKLLRLVPVERRGGRASRVMLVSVWFTVTLTVLVVESPPASVIVTWKV